MRRVVLDGAKLLVEVQEVMRINTTESSMASNDAFYKRRSYAITLDQVTVLSRPSVAAIQVSSDLSTSVDRNHPTFRALELVVQRCNPAAIREEVAEVVRRRDMKGMERWTVKDGGKEEEISVSGATDDKKLEDAFGQAASLRAKKRREPVERSSKDQQASSDVREVVISVPRSEEVLAPRVLKALEHLVQLHGGKKEPF